MLYVYLCMKQVEKNNEHLVYVTNVRFHQKYLLSPNVENY